MSSVELVIIKGALVIRFVVDDRVLRYAHYTVFLQQKMYAYVCVSEVIIVFCSMYFILLC